MLCKLNMILLIVIVVLVVYMLYRNYELFNTTSVILPTTLTVEAAEAAAEAAADTTNFKKVCECKLDSSHSSPQHNYPNDLKKKYYDYHIGLNNENEFYSFINNSSNNQPNSVINNTSNCI